MEFTPIKVAFNEYGYNQTLKEYNYYKNHFQTYIDEIISLNIEAITIEENDLSDLFTNPKEFFANKIITEPTVINGLTLDKSKTFELLDIPIELKNIISKISQEIIFRENDPKSNFYQYADFFIVDNGNVEVKPSLLEQWQNQYSIFITNEKQEKVNNNLNIIIEKLHEITEIHDNSNIDFVLDRYLDINGKNISVKYNNLKKI
ncbi:hypothetical protein [Epilithonimonas hispanica]|uniref:Uncharacterized protein n=1 Tax=Epilithonimonas hispanica TaxID=358687 RepID=A0A3D9CIH7_9FLAO|nr:hypothetical protein [Epilithonimonas hispanica]REC65516.1 hypothetical protein DRF58_17865 [Epilithonimonas hispanica]